jgi:hypothetical protein
MEAPAMVAASGCAAEPAGQDPFASEVAAVMPAPDLGEGLVGALHDALAADINPGAGRHLAVHHEPLAIELVELLPGGPMRHQVRVGDQDARRVGVGAKDADRLARLHQQRLVGLERFQGLHDAVEALPVARGAADAAIDHQLLRLLRHLGVEIVHEHAQGRLGEPTLGVELGSAGALDLALVVEPLGRAVGIGTVGGGHIGSLGGRGGCPRLLD